MNTKGNKNIEFLGTAEFRRNDSIEFANRYLRENYRGIEGKELTKAIATDKAKEIQVDRSSHLRQDRQRSKAAKSRLKALVEKGKSDPLLKPLEQRQAERVALLEKKRNSLNAKKQKLAEDIKKGIDEAEQKRANQPPKPKPDVRYKPLPKRDGVVKQLGKALLKNKGKLALLAGAGTLGAVGYGLIRKARSDKGKKRRFYNR